MEWMGVPGSETLGVPGAVVGIFDKSAWFSERGEEGEEERICWETEEPGGLTRKPSDVVNYLHTSRIEFTSQSGPCLDSPT